MIESSNHKSGARKSGVTLVLITHHVEEITPSFSHALVLKDGRVLAAGAKKKALTSKVLSEAFGADLRLRRMGGRYDLGPGSGTGSSKSEIRNSRTV